MKYSYGPKTIDADIAVRKIRELYELAETDREMYLIAKAIDAVRCCPNCGAKKENGGTYED